MAGGRFPRAHLAPQSKERIRMKLKGLRNGSPKDSHSRQVVRKCPSPVTPTFLRNEPFGENVEGLSYCGDKELRLAD